MNDSAGKRLAGIFRMSSGAPLETTLGLFALIVPPLSLFAPKAVVPLLMVAATVVAIACWRRDGRLPLPDLYMAGLLSPLLVWAAVASFWTFDTERALVLVLRQALLLAGGLVLWSAAAQLDEHARWQVSRLLMTGVSLTGLILVLELLFGFQLLRWLFGPLGTEGDQAWRLNRGATMLALLIWPVTAALWRRGAGARALLAPVALNLFLVFFSNAAAVAGLAAGLVAVCAELARRRAGQVLLALAIVATIAGSPLAAKQFHAWGWVEAEWLPSSARHRVHLWNFTADRIFEKPLLGWGFDASRNMPNLGVTPYAGLENVIALHPHSAGLQVLLELGIVGAGLMLLLLLAVLYRLRRLPRPARALALGQYMTILAIASTAYGLWQTQWVATILTTVVLAEICLKTRG